MVVLKLAASLDGRAAARDGSSRWISGEASRADVHRIRAMSEAIAVGVGTVLADDPSLTVRLAEYRGRPPLRVVLDSKGRTPSSAAILEGQAPTLIATTPAAPETTRACWEASGAEVVVIDEPDAHGGVALRPVLELLGKRDVQTILLEGGPTLAWSAVRDGLVDRLVVYLAPKLVGGRDAPGLLQGDGVERIQDAFPVSIREIERLGDDVKLVGDVHGHH